MLKKHMAACLVASAFITVPALAQTSPGATSPGAAPPATGASSASGASAAGGAGRFITQQQQNQWRASRLIGINVYGADNERIGDINEVLVDRQGNADAVVVGVGGFLGIGEKNVALPFSAFEWQMDDTRRTASASGTAAGTGGAGTGGAGRTATGTAAGTGDMAGAGAGAGSGTGAGPGTAGTTASTGTAGSGTGGAAGTTASTSAAGGGTSGSAARSSGADRGYPDHAVLRMTKADLEKAEPFRYVGDRADSGSGSGTGAGRSTGGAGGTGGAGTSGTAPRP